MARSLPGKAHPWGIVSMGQLERRYSNWGGGGIKTQLAEVLQVPLESDRARLNWGRACPCRLGVIGSVSLEVDVPGQIILVHKVS